MADFKNLRETARRLVEERAAFRANELRNIIILNLTGTGGGRLYVKRNPNREHRASAPGAAPASDTGRLRGSIALVRKGPAHYRVGTNVEYAPLLEFGTRRIAPRPFLRPSLEELLRRFP